jgi:tetratricopeptide (TPR) repeat protein
MVDVRHDVGIAVAAAFAAVIALAQCGGGNPPPIDVVPLPQVDLSTLDPNLSERLAPKLAALRANPEDASLNGEVGKLLHAYRQFGPAAQFYQRARVLEPSSLQWSYYLGVVWAGDGLYDAAIGSFRSALAIDPAFTPAKKRLARALLDAGKLDESMLIYKALLVNDPDDPEVRNGLGRVHAALGHTEEAAAHLTRAVEILPNYGEAHYALALAYRDLGDEERASDHLRRYEADALGAPLNVDPLMAAVNDLNKGPREYLRAAIEAEKAGRIREAIEHNLQALQLDPDLHPAHAGLIVLYGLVGEPDSARRHYRRALALNPNSVVVHYNYGRLCYDEGHYEQAYASFQRALQINPNDAFVNNNIGEASEQLGRREDAIRYYQRAIANRPDYGHAHFNLGRTMMQKDRLADAIREFQLALEEETFRTPTYLVTLASAYAKLGKISEASNTLELARRMAQQYGQAEMLETIDRDISRLAAQSAP